MALALGIYKCLHCGQENNYPTLALFTDLPALYVGLELLERLQFLHLSLCFIDVGAHFLHGLQSFLHGRVICMLLRSPFQQFLQWTHNTRAKCEEIYLRRNLLLKTQL